MAESINNEKHDGDLLSSLGNLRSILQMKDNPTNNASSLGSLRGWSNAEEQNKKLESELKEERSLHAKQKASFEDLSRYKKELAMQFELVKKARDSLEEKSNEATRALQAEKTMYSRKEKEWKFKMEQLTGEKTELENECARLKAKGNYQKTQIDELKPIQQERDDLKIELEDLKVEMELKIAEHEKKIQEDKNSLEELKQRLDDTEKTKQEQVEQVERLYGDLKDAQQDRVGAKKSLKSFMTAMDEDSMKDDDSENDLEGVVNQVGIVMEQMRTKNSELQSDKAALAQDLENARTENEEVAVELASSREKWRDARDELCTLKEDYEDQKDQINELENQLRGAGDDAEDDESHLSSSPRRDDMDLTDSFRGQNIEIEDGDEESSPRRQKIAMEDADEENQERDTESPTKETAHAQEVAQENTKEIDPKDDDDEDHVEMSDEEVISSDGCEENQELDMESPAKETAHAQYFAPEDMKESDPKDDDNKDSKVSSLRGEEIISPAKLSAEVLEIDDDSVSFESEGTKELDMESPGKKTAHVQDFSPEVLEESDPRDDDDKDSKVSSHHGEEILSPAKRTVEVLEIDDDDSSNYDSEGTKELDVESPTKETAHAQYFAAEDMEESDPRDDDNKDSKLSSHHGEEILSPAKRTAEVLEIDDDDSESDKSVVETKRLKVDHQEEDGKEEDAPLHEV